MQADSSMERAAWAEQAAEPLLMQRRRGQVKSKGKWNCWKFPAMEALQSL
jgi:hypothetical protein